MRRLSRRASVRMRSSRGLAMIMNFLIGNSFEILQALLRVFHPRAALEGSLIGCKKILAFDFFFHNYALDLKLEGTFVNMK